MINTDALMIFYLGVVLKSKKLKKSMSIGKRVYSLLNLYLGIGRSLYRLKDSCISSIRERVEIPILN
jgi:hypothetical protein